MFNILSSKTHIFSQLICSVLGVLIVLKIGIVNDALLEWTLLPTGDGGKKYLDVWIVVLINPVFMALIAYTFDLIVGRDDGTATYEQQSSVMYLAFSVVAIVCMALQFTIFLKT